MEDVRCTQAIACNLKFNCRLYSETPSTMNTKWVSPDNISLNTRCNLYQPKLISSNITKLKNEL